MTMKAMTRETIESQREKLIEQHNELELLVQRIDGDLAQARAEGDTNINVDLLRSRRRDAIDEANEISEALHLLEDAAAATATKELKAAQTAARKEAKEAAEKIVAACADLDAALVAVGKAYDAVKLHSYDFTVASRRAGITGNNRLTNMLGNALRWAAYHASDQWATQTEIPRVPASRRRPLAESILSFIPKD